MSVDSRLVATSSGIKARAARLVGRTDWVHDGRTDVPLGLVVINFVVQRVFRLNVSCRYPVHFTSTVVNGGLLTAGRGVAKYLAMSGGVYIQALNGVTIGDDTMLGPGVKMISANHVPGVRSEWTEAEPILIGERCWIAANAVILPGVTVGDEAVVGAGAVVTKDVAPGATVVGVPARPLTPGHEPRKEEEHA